jgi:tetratricopeptide (TPR) repeat protein
MKPSKKKTSGASLKSRKYLSVVILIAIIAVAAVILVITRPATPSVPSDTNTSFQTAGSLYTKSVDLANGGQYQQALDAADQALALNVSSLNPLIQSNRAGILVMLGDNTGAITAADAAISAEGNLTTVRSIAWFNKGNALRNLGRTDEARAAYANATALDPSLQAPHI